MDRKKLEIYNNKYFVLNKRLQMVSGLWPYASQKDKLFRRILVAILLVLMILPNVNGTRVWCGKDVGLCGENVSGLAYVLGVISKYGVTIFYEDKLKRLYVLVANNWLSISDLEEKKILKSYAARGRLISIAYVAYMIAAGFAFSQLTILPIVLDIILPLNQSRPKILVVKGEYIIDPYEYYYELYVAYCIFAVASVAVFTGVDTTYVAVVHQSLGIFTIIKHRIHKATSYSWDHMDESYKGIISAIQLHKKALQFVNIIESSYDLCFLSLIVLTVFLLSAGAITILDHVGHSLDLLRMAMFEMGVTIHLFYMSWPGQKVMDHCSDLFITTYANEWYNISEKGKILLKIMMMRCFKPCILTAGGLYVMNFENYGALIKTTVSYITVAISFRE